MYEVNKRSVTSWFSAPHYSNVYVPASLDVGCPYCHRDPVNSPLPDWEVRSDLDHAHGTCPACHNTIDVWVWKRPSTSDDDKIAKARVFMLPAPRVHPPFDNEIEEISPSFVKIYNQALQAEAQGLDDLVGMGLRKSLEFLVKDFLIRQRPADEESIKKEFLGNLIKDDVSDENIKAVAARAVWLGNDETHYERRWENHDLTDLKRLLQLTIYWITMSLLTKRTIADMPETGKP